MKPASSVKTIAGWMQTWMVVLLTIKILAFCTLSDSAAVAKVIKVILGLMTTGGMFLVYQRIIRHGYVPSWKYENAGALILYVAYLGLGLLSFIWTSDVSVSALQWIRDVELLLFAIVLVRSILLLQQYEPEYGLRYSKVLALPLFFNLCFFLIGYWIDPETFMRLTHGGEVARLGGQIMNPNELGMLAGLTVASCYVELKNGANKFLYLLIVLAGVYTLVLTGSRSSMIGFAIITLFYIRKSSSPLLKIGTLVAMGISLPIVVQVIFLKEGAQTGSADGLEEVMSMTGRLPFWKALLTEGLPREPLLGYGFMRINYTTYFQGANTYPAAMTHNTFIQVLMNLGLIGFTIVLLQMVLMGVAIKRQKEVELRDYALVLLIPLLINSFTEFGIWGEVNYSILFYQILIVAMVTQYNPLLSLKDKLHFKARRRETAVIPKTGKPTSQSETKAS